MAYFVDRVVVCDAYEEPERHYQRLQGGKSALREGRRPSMRFLASAKQTRGGIAGVLGMQTSLLEDNLANLEEQKGGSPVVGEGVRAW